MARRKEKNGEKSPWGQCLTRPVPNSRAVLASDWCQKTFLFFCPIKRQNGGDRLELVWQDIVPRGSSRRSLIFFVPYFAARLDFSLPLLSAPGSPRMSKLMLSHFCSFYSRLSFFLSSANINRVLFTSFTLENHLQKTIFFGEIL